MLDYKVFIHGSMFINLLPEINPINIINVKVCNDEWGMNFGTWVDYILTQHIGTLCADSHERSCGIQLINKYIDAMLMVSYAGKYT